MKLNQLFFLLAVLILIVIQVEGYQYRRHQKKKYRLKIHQNKESENTSPNVEQSTETSEDSLEHLPSSSQEGSTHEDFVKALKHFHLSGGEIDSLFRVADQNHDGIVSNSEWQGFDSLFLVPFQKYDQGKKNRLSEDEAMQLLQSQDFKVLNLTEESKDVIFDSLGKVQKERFLNLADYLFLRRSKLAWEQCAIDGVLSQVQIRCALEINVPGKRLEFSEERKIFDSALILKQGKQSGDRAYLKFLEFLNIARIYYYFHEFQLPFVNGQISKKDILRAINNQVLPHHLTPNIIQQMYGNQESYDFSGFACSFWVHRLFVKHSQTVSNKLTEQEFLELLNDKNVPKLILKYVDEFYNPTQEEIEAVSQRNAHSLTEQDFLINSRFLQVKQNETQGNQEQQEGNNRNMVFSIFDQNNAGNITFGQLQQFFKYTWAFLSYDINVQMSLDANQIRQGMIKVHSCIPFDQQEMTSLNKVLDQLTHSKSENINVKQFYSLLTYEQLFSNLVVLGSNNHCIFSRLQEGMNHLGLKISKSNRALSQEGYDHVLKETTYNWRECFKNALSEEMSVLHFKANGVKLNQVNNNEEQKEETVENK